MENKATNGVVGYAQPAGGVRRAMGRFIDRYFKYIMITPVTVILAGVAMYPFFYALYISLTNAKTANFRSPKFIGLLNYWNIIISLRYWQATGVTIMYVGGVLILEIGIALLLAVLVDKATKGQKWYVTLLITPMLISTVFTGIIFRLQLNPEYGVIPYYLAKIGIKTKLLDTGHALLTTLLIDVWQWTSFIFLIAFAGLKSLPVEPFEAARVYGAKPWQTFRYVTFPLLKPVLTIAVIFRMMDAFKAFDHIYILTNGGPGNATTTFTVLAYRYAYTRDSFGMAAAMTILLLLMVIFLTKNILKLAKWQ